MIVERVSHLLESRGGYRLTSQPMRIDGIEFKGDFDAVLEGPDDERGLVLVVDASALPLKTVLRRLKAACLALTRTRSTRPASVVLITEQTPDAPILAELQALCRLIVIPAGAGPEECLRGLLRLKLPQEQTVKSAGTVLEEELGGGATDPFVSALIKAARKGPADVERTVREHIDRAAKLEASEGRGHD